LSERQDESQDSGYRHLVTAAMALMLAAYVFLWPLWRSVLFRLPEPFTASWLVVGLLSSPLVWMEMHTPGFRYLVDREEQWMIRVGILPQPRLMTY
jgi:hypothetical protein